jgi:hypothetical protein
MPNSLDRWVNWTTDCEAASMNSPQESSLRVAVNRASEIQLMLLSSMVVAEPHVPLLSL